MIIKRSRLSQLILLLPILGLGIAVQTAADARRTAVVGIPIIRPGRTPRDFTVGAKNPRKAAAMKPNLDILVPQTCYAPGQRVRLTLSEFNEKEVSFAAYQIDLGNLVKSSRTLEIFAKTIGEIDLSGQHPVVAWHSDAHSKVPDAWEQSSVDVPKLGLGTYLIAATNASGVQKRLWFAVTNAALITKYSYQELEVYAVNAQTGQPLAGAQLTSLDYNGLIAVGRTDSSGLVKFAMKPNSISGWVYGATADGPAFVWGSAPSPPDPYTVYWVTARPVYRPGNLVQYKSTVRRRIEGVGDAGFTYQPYTGPVKLDVKDANGALIESRTVTTSDSGSLSGSIQLAPEASIGDWEIDYQIGDSQGGDRFSVQAYRKPEMLVTSDFDKSHYLGGSTIPVTVSAQYYFGQPVTDATVRYHVDFSRDSGREDFDGQGVTDKLGHLKIEIPTKHLNEDETLQLNATVTDLSRRKETSEGSTVIASALFQLSLTTDKDQYLVGKQIAVTVRANDYDDKPVVTPVRIKMIVIKHDRLHRAYQEVTVRDVKTGPDGTAVAYFSSPRPGNVIFVADAVDAEQDNVRAVDSVDVYESLATPPPDSEPLSLILHRDTYKPGETAIVELDTTLVGTLPVAATPNSPAEPAHPDAWALVTIEGEKINWAEVLHLSSRKALLRIPITVVESPSVTVKAVVVQDDKNYDAEQQLNVTNHDHDLLVAVTTDKSAYHPGETATYTVTTRDSLKRPVPAEVSLGVVDQSIYAIKEDQSDDINDAFYSDPASDIQSDFSFTAIYSGRGYEYRDVTDEAEPHPTASFQFDKAVAAPRPTPMAFSAVRGSVTAISGSASSDIRVRKQFADTAYWNPVLQTDENGTAQLSYTVPDNLTTWRATAHGITLDTKVGTGTQDVVSSMPLLVRLEMPRFLVQGDQSVVSAIVQEDTKEARSVSVHLDVQGAELSGKADQTIQLDPNGQQRLDWTVAVGAGSNAVFTVTADGGAGAQDSAQQTLPVLADGVEVVESEAAALPDSTSASYMYDLSKFPADSTITLTLSPSIGSAVYDALDDLESKPYGDSEDAASCLFTDAAAAEVSRHMKAPHTIDPHLDGWVGLALQKLYRYQHADGGWNWWEFDQTDGDMTSYVLNALIEARNAGYTVDSQCILNGTKSLSETLSQSQDLSQRAEWLMSIAYADPKSAAKPLSDLYAQRAHLGTYALASLAIGLSRIGGSDASAKAATVAGELVKSAVVEGRSASWPLEPGGCLWSDDDVTLTAHVMRALMAADPSGSAGMLPEIANWLMINRDGKSWDSTRASCEAVVALTQLHGQQRRALQQLLRASVVGRAVDRDAECHSAVYLQCAGYRRVDAGPAPRP